MSRSFFVSDILLAFLLNLSIQGTLEQNPEPLRKQHSPPDPTHKGTSTTRGNVKISFFTMKSVFIAVQLVACCNGQCHAQPPEDLGSVDAEEFQAILDDLEGHQIDLNDASAQDLEALPGLAWIIHKKWDR